MPVNSKVLFAVAACLAVVAGVAFYFAGLDPGTGGRVRDDQLAGSAAEASSKQPPAVSEGSDPAPVAGAIAAGPNEMAPSNVELTDLDGRAYTLEAHRGKLVIVNFWATWCTPCLNEIPILVKLQERYGARGFQLIGPAVDDVEEIRRAAPNLKFNYPLAVGDPETMLDLMNQLGNTQGGLPFSVVIGPDGKILERQLGEYSEVELAGLIEAHLPAPQ